MVTGATVGDKVGRFVIPDEVGVIVGKLTLGARDGPDVGSEVG